MSHNFLLNSSFHRSLLEIDLHTANAVRDDGCSHCGGNLHQAHYPRIGFGIYSQIAPLYTQRLSFCCAVCRRRTTPPSLRFLGRRRYVAAVFVLLGALRLNPCERCCEQLRRRFGLNVSLSTWKRWRAWWRQHFPQHRFWIAAKARFPLTLQVTPLPRALLQQFTGALLEQRLIKLLSFLSPLTTGAV